MVLPLNRLRDSPLLRTLDLSILCDVGCSLPGQSAWSWLHLAPLLRLDLLFSIPVDLSVLFSSPLKLLAVSIAPISPWPLLSSFRLNTKVNWLNFILVL